MDICTIQFQFVNRARNTTQWNGAIAIALRVKAVIAQSKESHHPALGITNKVKPKLGLVHHIIGGDAGAIASAPLTSLVDGFCEFKPMNNISFHKTNPCYLCTKATIVLDE